MRMMCLPLNNTGHKMCTSSDRLEDIWSFVLDAFKICDCDKFLSTTPVMQFLL